ncbi:uncharacterized protein [Triticum aestivum]|uniref:uncharacterized protein n=1 Tax=Triticum aestivum TaxID=4565 RepID=UPI001D02D8BB|nr:uncharacterized protein LOC123114762 [Triticum aestivum]
MAAMAQGDAVAPIHRAPVLYLPRRPNPTLAPVPSAPLPLPLYLPSSDPLLPELRHGRVAGVDIDAALPAVGDRARGTAIVAYFDYVGELGPKDTRVPTASPSSTSVRPESSPPSSTSATSAAPKPLDGPPYACSVYIWRENAGSWNSGLEMDNPKEDDAGKGWLAEAKPSVRPIVTKLVG